MKKVFIISILVGCIGIVTTLVFLGFNSIKVDAEEYTIDNPYINLQEKPEDFIIIQRDVMKNEYPDICQIEPEYYKRPEFYPNWEQMYDSHYQGHNFGTWGVNGYGMYPADTGIAVMNLKKDEVITLCSFLKTAGGVETYQGIKLQPRHNEFFEVITDPSILLLQPTFPAFSEDWVYKIQIQIKAKKDVPPGEYEVGLNVVSPSKEMDEQFKWQVLEKELNMHQEYIEKCSKDINSDCYKQYMERQKKYVKGGQWNIGRPFYKTTIVVLEEETV